jgi:RNA polymerase sigma factor (sigma-70 family)
LPAITQHTNLSDDELLATYRRDGDNQWMGYLLQRYTALLLGVALKYLKDKPQAEDAVQQVFIKVLTHLPKDPILNFKGWLYILMRNHCLEQLRGRTYNADESALGHLVATEPDAEEIKWQEHTLQQMNEAIELLNDDQRRSIVLFYFKKYSYEQIIAETGFTFMQVKSFIQNGKRNLKTILLKKLGNRRQ